MRSPFRLLGVTAVAALVVTLLPACSQPVPLKPAEDATNPACAEIIVRLPDGIDGFAQRETNAQATGAWGDPAAIFLRCGVPVPGPSALPCFTIKDVDWLRDDSEAPVYKFITYGRDPAVEVVIDGDRASSSALSALGNAVGSVPATKQCLAAEDVFGEEE